MTPLRGSAGTSRSRTTVLVLLGSLLVMSGCASEQEPTSAEDGTADPADPANDAETEADAEADAEEDAAAEPDTVRIAAAVENLGCAAMLLAVAAETPAEHGLEFEVRNFDGSSANALAATMSGETDMVVAGSGSLIDPLTEGVELRTVALMSTVAGNLALASDVAETLEAESGVSASSPLQDRLAALEGLTIATTPAGTTNDAYLQYMLRQGGLDPAEDVEIVPAAEAELLQEGLRQGRYDAGYRGGGALAPVLADGAAVVWVDAAEVEGLAEAMFCQAFVPAETMDESPDLMERVHQAFADGVAAAETSDELQAQVKEMYYPDVPDDVYDYIWREAEPSFPPDATLSETAWNSFLDLQSQITGKDYSELDYATIVAPFAQG